MPRSIWRDVADFQAEERIATEAESLRRLVIAGLRAYREPNVHKVPDKPHRKG